jgi:hypothetical protein
MRSPRYSEMLYVYADFTTGMRREVRYWGQPASELIKSGGTHSRMSDLALFNVRFEWSPYDGNGSRVCEYVKWPGR